MPLGASITYGIDSSDGNGYCLALAENLSGTKLRFIGSVKSGTMDDNYNEGHPGATIRDVANFARALLGYQPNVILLHAGTKDFDTDRPKETTEGAPQRLAGLIDGLVFACPNATILVAQLIHATNPLYDRRIQLFNDQVPGIVAQRAKAGHRVMVADMRSITKEYLAEGIHPTDVGYKKMADIWFAGIQAAHAKGWIQRPMGPNLPEIVPNAKGQVVTPKKRQYRKQAQSTRGQGGEGGGGSAGGEGGGGGGGSGGGGDGGSGDAAGGCKDGSGVPGLSFPGLQLPGLNLPAVKLPPLCLPKIGSGAINGLKPLASDAVNAINRTGGAITSLARGGSSLASSDVSIAANLVSNAYQGQSKYDRSESLCTNL